MKIKAKKKGGPVCLLCNSRNILTNVTGISRCRRCGWCFEVKNIQEEEKKK